MKKLALALSLACLAPSAVRADDKIIVHEWGTFTCLQDEQGQAIGGINVDDEPVPYFVSSVAVGVAPQYNSGFGFPNLGLPPYEEGKGWISGDPHVTMRLETPVIYFYPPHGQPDPSAPPLDVHVDFHGGVLSQFYPHADFSGLPKLRFPGQPQDNIFPYVDKATGITGATLTSLDWNDVQLGSSVKPVETEDKVWTTPREVGASVLQVTFAQPDGKGMVKTLAQSEHFLFYRGVGHVDSPLFILPDADKAMGAGVGSYVSAGITDIDAAWIVDIGTDGRCAFRPVVQRISVRANGGAVVDLQSPHLHGSFTSGEKISIAHFPTSFMDSDFTADNLPKLKASMHDGLVKAGLYDDEATAMLKTWDLSYFKSPGLRFFYLVPRAWVDKVLPLTITGPATDITRVMVGRIELVTDAQRAALARLSTGPCPDLAALKHAAFDAIAKVSANERQPYYSGEKPLRDLGIPIPPLVQDYLSLGRFRDALIVREQQQHPSAALAQFIKDNQLVPQ